MSLLRRSFVNYKRPGDRDFQAREVIDKLPNEAYSLAEIYQHTFSEAIGATYLILVGNHRDIPSSGEGQKGVLDILLFPLLVRAFIGKAVKMEFGVSSALLLCIGGVLQIPYAIIGLALIIALIPLIAVIHAGISCWAAPLKNAVMSAPITEITFDPENKKKIIEGENSTVRQLIGVKSKIRYISVYGDRSQPAGYAQGAPAIKALLKHRQEGLKPSDDLIPSITSYLEQRNSLALAMTTKESSESLSQQRVAERRTQVVLRYVTAWESPRFFKLREPTEPTIKAFKALGIDVDCSASPNR